MSFFLNRGGGRHISRDATFRLTQEGTDKLGDYRGDAKSNILMALDTGGTSTIEEISRNSGLSKRKVEAVLPNLMRNGYVVYATSIPQGVD